MSGQSDLRFVGLEVRSLVTKDSRLQISLERVTLDPPSPSEVIVRVEGAPVNPSDLGLLLGSVPPADLRSVDRAELPALEAPIGRALFERLRGRVDQSLAVGVEGMGIVVAAGVDVTGLLGKTVAMFGGGMYAQYRRIAATSCMALPEGTPAEVGAGSLVNPMTSLSMVETMRRERHRALVHTAAASNLGKMLVRICKADGVGLVNVVRSPTQAMLLRDLGAAYICDSSSPTFSADLVEAIAATGATLAFDAVGGGDLASLILGAMENAADRSAAAYSRYGDATHKQVYVYGGMDSSPIVLRKDFGMAWSVGGWLLFPFLQRIGDTIGDVMKARVVRELRTTFASEFTRTVSLAELLQSDTLVMAAARSTGKKFLLKPQA